MGQQSRLGARVETGEKLMESGEGVGQQSRVGGKSRNGRKTEEGKRCAVGIVQHKKHTIESRHIMKTHIVFLYQEHSLTLDMCKDRCTVTGL